MKKDNIGKSIFLSLVIAAVFITSCSKSTTNIPGTSQWTINKINYKGINTSFADTAGAVRNLISEDPAYNSITVEFGSAVSSNGSFPVEKSQAGRVTGNQCSLDVIYQNGSQDISTGGGTVQVIVKSGKVTASFSGIPVSNGINNSTISGTLIEQ